MQIKRKFLKSHLEKRFPKIYVERIIEFFELNSLMTMNELVDKVNIFLLFGKESLFQLAFQLYDLNED